MLVETVTRSGGIRPRFIRGLGIAGVRATAAGVIAGFAAVLITPVFVITLGVTSGVVRLGRQSIRSGLFVIPVVVIVVIVVVAVIVRTASI